MSKTTTDRWTTLSAERDALLDDAAWARDALYQARGTAHEADAQGAVSRAEAALDAWLASPEGQEWGALDAGEGFALARREFARWLHLYDLGDVTIPEGFADTSWHNDACPSIEGKGVRVWIDAVDPARRECGGFPSARFIVQPLLDGYPDGEAVLMSEDWTEVQRFLAALPTSA